MALTKITPQMFDTSATAHDLNVDNGTFVVDGSASRVGIGTATPSTLLDVNGAVTTSGNLTVNANANVTGNLTVDTNSFYVDATNNRVGIGTTSPSNKLDVNGAFTASSVGVDNLLLDGNEIDSSSGHIVLDSADEIKLDAHSGIIRVQTQGGDIGMIRALNSDLQIRSMVSDKDIVFYGNDGGSGFTALTLDMSAVGAATFAGPVLAPAGSASVPSLSFSGDPNTGLYSLAGDNIGFAIGGSARAFLSATQFNMTGNIVASGTVTVGNSNLGSNTSHLANLTINNNAYIGTTSTATAIQIATAGGVTFASSVKLSGQTSSDGLRLDLAGSTDYKIGETSTNDIVSFGAAGGAATHLIHHNISSGQLMVGVGSLASDYKAAFESTTYLGMLLTNTSTSIADNGTIGFIDFGAGSSRTVNARMAGLSDGTNENGGHVVFETRVAGGGLSEKLRIEGSGNVGIGTNDPDEILHVKGDGARIYVDSTDYNLFSIGRRGSSGADLDKAYLRMKNAGTNTIVLDTAGDSYFNGGNVGIGTAAPASILHIEASTNSYATAPVLYFGSTSTANAGVRDWAIGPADSAYGNFHIFRGASTGASPIGNAGTVFTIDNAGQVGLGKTGYFAPAANLHVKGSGANGQIYIGGTTTNTYGKIYSDNDGVLVLAADGGNNAANSYLALEVDGSARVAVNGTGTVFGDVSTLADGMTGTPNDLNQAEIGPGFLRLKRDDTANAQQLTFDKNGSTHSYFETGTSGLIYVVNSGDHRFNADVIPNLADSYDLGTSALRWRNGYFNDFHLSNEGIEGGNDIDGTTGDWTIQEGEEHLYIKNNKTGKKFRFALEEVT